MSKFSAEFRSYNDGDKQSYRNARRDHDYYVERWCRVCRQASLSDSQMATCHTDFNLPLEMDFTGSTKQNYSSPNTLQYLLVVFREVVILLRLIHIFIHRLLLSAQSLQLSHQSSRSMLTAALIHLAHLQAGRRRRHCLHLVQPAPLFPKDTINVLVSLVLFVYSCQ